MKRRRKAGIAALLLIAAVCAAAAVWFFGDRKLMTADAAWEDSGDGDRMTVVAEIGEDLRILSGTQTLTAGNRTGKTLEEIVLRVPANAVRENCMVISEVRADGVSVEFAFDEDDPTVLRIGAPWAEGETVELSWRFHLTVPLTGGGIGRTAESALLVSALPTLAVYESGAWRTDAYDDLAESSYAQAFELEMTLFAPMSVKAVFGGALTEASPETGPDTMMYTVRMSGARDVSLALRTDGALRQRKIGGVLVSALADGVLAANALLDRAQEALASLDAAGLASPFPSLSIVQDETYTEDGIVGSGLIALDAESDKEQLLRRITRLIARQTFGVLVENDPWNAPWLSQTLASAAEMLAYRQRRGSSAYETRYYEELEVSTRLTRPYGVTVGASTAHFGGDSEMTQVLRDQGAAMLLGIEQAVGEEAFLSALQRYARENAGKIATQQSLEEALREATGSSWDGYLSDGLAS